MALGAEARTFRPAAWMRGLVEFTGKGVSWLTLLMVLLAFAVVILRYGLDIGWIWLQDAVVYLHATVFMLAAAWALQTDEHVRVDIFYRGRAPRPKAIIDLLGTVFLLVPFCVFLLLQSLDYVQIAWATRESSREAGGLPLVWLLKTLILLLPALLLVEAVNGIAQNLRKLRRSRV